MRFDASLVELLAAGCKSPLRQALGTDYIICNKTQLKFYSLKCQGIFL